MRNQKEQNRREKGARAKALALSDARSINIILLVAGVALFVGFLMLNSQASTKGFAMREVEREIAALEDARKKLDMEAVSMQSLQRVEEQVGTLGMVPIETVDYVNVGAPAVAVR